MSPIFYITLPRCVAEQVQAGRRPLSAVPLRRLPHQAAEAGMVELSDAFIPPFSRNRVMAAVKLRVPEEQMKPCFLWLLDGPQVVKVPRAWLDTALFHILTPGQIMAGCRRQLGAPLPPETIPWRVVLERQIAEEGTRRISPYYLEALKLPG